jgi:hypothetical protein
VLIRGPNAGQRTGLGADVRIALEVGELVAQLLVACLDLRDLRRASSARWPISQLA